jgi:ankyrin repeat protein
VKRILDELPESLDVTYERVLKSINKANRDHAFRLLQCVAVAVRPLRVEELAEVLAVDFDAARNGGFPNLKPDWRWSDQHQAVLSTCSSLIAIVDDGDFQVVQFSHFSVKEFLTSDRLACSNGDVSRYHILLSTAHIILAQACLGVLLRLDDHTTNVNASDIPLARYAARYWVDHAQFEDVSSHIQDVTEYFFDADKPHWAAWHRVYDIDDQDWSVFTPASMITSPLPLYYAALCGFNDLAEHLIVKNPEHVNARGGRMVTPLVAALHRGHFRVADLLHGHGSDLHPHGAWGLTPLHGASGDGLVDIMRWLLDHGANVNARSDEGFTPLHLRMALWRPEICRILLEHNADINAQDEFGKVPLHWAAMNRYARDTKDKLKTMQLLLDRGADPNVLDDDGCTPLHDSSWWKKKNYGSNGTVEGAHLLLDHGANIDAENNEGKTPLQLALEAGYREMVDFWAGRGAK